MIEKNTKVYVAGHTGMIGSAICRKLAESGVQNILMRTHDELELKNSDAVSAFFEAEQPQYVFLAAGKVGGIKANIEEPASFIAENLAMQMNVITAAHRAGVKKLLFYGISCSYPSAATQPMREESLLTGSLEVTSEAYAVAKIAGIKMCQAYRKQYGCNFIAAIPASPYGPNDNYDLAASHVIPGLINKFHNAKQKKLPTVQIWGTGKPIREFIYVDDLADASIFLMKHYDGSDVINIGSGYEISISELVEIVRDTVGYDGDIIYDTSRTDGVPRKFLDMSKLHNLGWRPSTDIRHGLLLTYNWYKNHVLNEKDR